MVQLTITATGRVPHKAALTLTLFSTQWIAYRCWPSPQVTEHWTVETTYESEESLLKWGRSWVVQNGDTLWHVCNYICMQDEVLVMKTLYNEKNKREIDGVEYLQDLNQFIYTLSEGAIELMKFHDGHK